MFRRFSNWFRSVWKRGSRFYRWFIPGIGVKRWFLVLLGGITLIGTGVAIFLLDVYRTAPKTWWLPILSFISLRFLTRPWRIVIFGGLGLGLIGLGFWRLNQALLRPFVRPGQRLVDQVTDFRRREHGPHIVAIGGGHGIATVLRGLKNFTNNLTAVVSVADDGGSSGELRRSLGILPPGDIRNCLAALSDDEALLTQLFQYRFGEDTGLGGHSFGNLFISALSDITGSFEKAIAESGAPFPFTDRCYQRPCTMSGWWQTCTCRTHRPRCGWRGRARSPWQPGGCDASGSNRMRHRHSHRSSRPCWQRT